MKYFKLFSFLITLLTIISCSGSDSYRGDWKATDESGNRFTINFDEKSFGIKDDGGELKKYNYTQNKVSIKNSIKTYGIELSDGRSYSINFPNSEQKDVSIIYDQNGNILYTMSRNNYLQYKDIYKLR